jgi:hypothetical protein
MPLEVIENIQEAIWFSVSSMRAVLRRLVEVALEDERTEHLQAARHERADAPEHSVVHIVLVLALFRFCSSDESNITQHHDISRHIRKWP